MMEVELDVLNMEGWITSVAADNLCSIKILECIPWRGDGGHAKFAIRSGDGRKVLQEISSHPDIISIESELLSDETAIGSVAMKNCGLIRTILESGCFMEWAVSEGDGTVRMKITAGTEGSIPVLIKRMDEMGLIVEIKRMSPKAPSARLSRTQEDIVRRALIEGYYDVPRRITTKELAKMCYMAPSTLREILTRAEKNALKMMLEEGKGRY